ncbi:MAG: hypothetical protein ACI81P_001586 [Neolewinella sp.]
MFYSRITDITKATVSPSYLAAVLLFLAIIVLFTTLVTELAARRGWLPYWLTRKILHVIAVSACAIATLHVERELLTWIVASAEVLLLVLIFTNQLMREESGRRAWGIIWFPLAFLALLISGVPRPIIAFSMWVLALCDPAATIAGKLFARTTYNLTGDQKSIVGNLAFGLVFLLLALLFTVPTQLSEAADAPRHLLSVVQLIGWPGIFGMAIILTAGESLGSKGLDNLIVPLLAAWLWYGVDAGQYTLLLPLILGAALFSWRMVQRHSLTSGGALTASLLGIFVVIGSHSFLWLLPLFLFLLSSSLIGRLFPVTTLAGDAKQKQPRDATQVLANGAIYGWYALSLDSSGSGFRCFGAPIEYMLLLTAAIATADTWSSEVGQYFRWPTYDLVKWRRVPTGLSGGVSLPGTLAGLAGAAFLMGTCWWLLPYPNTGDILLIMLGGFCGMLIDSVLGSLFQAKYCNLKTGALSDTHGPNTELASGFKWVTNDLVNFIAILVGTWFFQYVILMF